MARLNRTCPLKLEIIKTAGEMFLTNGFTATAVSAICKSLDISTGNLTYYFPTKEHLLLELVKEMCEFQWETVSKYIESGASNLVAYALEITAQTALCEKNDIARDFYISGYTLPLTLAEIRDWDAKKAKKLFSKYNPDWQDSDYVLAEINASGLELAALMTQCNEVLTLEQKIGNTLYGLLRLYNVSEEECLSTIKTVLAIDYISISKDLFDEFKNIFCNIDFDKSH